jgi:hypothetical protein
MIDKAKILEALQRGDLSLQGQFLHGSNYTFLATVNHGELELPVVYKPTRGEQPLWDFPAGTLAKREVAAYLVSEALNWELVPPTVYRLEGPLGPGSAQYYIEHDPNTHYFSFNPDSVKRLKPTALFDLLINNADRKGGHILLDENQHIWLIDHGVCFHEDDKLRTVVWDFAGETIPAELVESVRAMLQEFEPDCQLRRQLARYLKQNEIRALVRRAQAVVNGGRFPSQPEHRRAYPWPPV